MASAKRRLRLLLLRVDHVELALGGVECARDASVGGCERLLVVGIGLLEGAGLRRTDPSELAKAGSSLRARAVSASAAAISGMRLGDHRLLQPARRIEIGKRRPPAPATAASAFAKAAR